jgi:hypothetical protein
MKITWNGDQVLRNFLNDWLFTCVEPKKIQNPNDVLAKQSTNSSERQ